MVLREEIQRLSAMIGHVTLGQLYLVSFFILSGFNHVPQDSCLLKEGAQPAVMGRCGRREQIENPHVLDRKKYPSSDLLLCA